MTATSSEDIFAGLSGRMRMPAGAARNSNGAELSENQLLGQSRSAKSTCRRRFRLRRPLSPQSASPK